MNHLVFSQTGLEQCLEILAPGDTIFLFGQVDSDQIPSSITVIDAQNDSNWSETISQFIAATQQNSCCSWF